MTATELTTKGNTTMQVYLPVSHLKAALCTAAKKDVRYYLNGISIEATKARTLAVGTDGHALGVAHYALTDAGIANELDGKDAVQFIVPRDACEMAVKLTESAKLSLVPIVRRSAEIWSIAGIQFNPIDGRFPDWRQAVPVGPFSGMAAQFDVALLDLFRKAVKAMGSRYGYIEIHQNGPEQTALVTGHNDYAGAVMPLRGNSLFAVPAWLAAS